MAVTETLAQLHLTPKSVALGEAQVDETLSPEQTSQVAEALRQKGFELVMDKKTQIVEDIKQAIITIARAEAREDSESYSTLLAEKLKTDYATLSRLFVAAEGRTIEKFYLLQRIEYVKELIEYGDLSIKRDSLAHRLLKCSPLIAPIQTTHWTHPHGLSRPWRVRP